MAIIVRAFKAVQVKDVQKPMFLAPKQKYWFSNVAQRSLRNVKGCFDVWIIQAAGQAGRQTGSSHENTINAFTVSLSPLSKANTHPSKLQIHFYRGKHTLLLIANKSIHHTWHLSFFNTTAIWGQETLQLHLKVRKLPRPLPPPQNMRGCGCTYCDYIFCRGGKQCATNLQFLASHHPDDHA